MLHILLAVLGVAIPGGAIGLVAKFGLTAVLGTAGSYLKRVPLWAWAAIAAAIFLAWTLHSRAQWKARADDRGAKLTVICQATRAAAGRPRLPCGQVPLQIKLLGQAVGTLKGAIGRQNAAIAALGTKTKQQQAEAVQARKHAQGRADAALATARRLAASATHAPAPGAPCEPSKALQESWK